MWFAKEITAYPGRRGKRRHVARELSIEVAAVFDAVNAAEYANAGPCEDRRMRRYGNSPVAGEGRHDRHFGFCPRRSLRIRAIEVKLDKICAVLDLSFDGSDQGIGILGFDRDGRGQNAGGRDPGPGRPDVRTVPATLPRVAYTQGQRPVIPWRGTDVAESASTGAEGDDAVLLGNTEQLVCLVVDP